jgi:hypothetical protein
MWNYRATILEVVDGDTVRTLIDQGLHGRQQEDLRLVDVWAPESGHPGGTETEMFVRGWMASLDKSRRWPIEVDTVPNTRPEPEERRSFVRYAADVRDIVTQRSLNDTVREFLAGHPEWGGGIGSG